MKFNVAYYFVFGLIVADFCSSESSETFSSASCELGLALLKLQSKLNNGNVILSPSSVGILLTILQQGARGNTLKQFDKVLRMTAEESKIGFGSLVKSLSRVKTNVTLEWASRGYLRLGLAVDETFNKTIEENFGAVIEELDFVIPSPKEATDIINAWVKMTTHDNIQNLISPSVLTPETTFILINAIFFKGLWDVPFKKVLTRQDKFELTPENSVEASFMSQKERFIAGEDVETGMKWIDLPFKDEQFSMLFILSSKRHGLDQILEKLDGIFLKKILDDNQTRHVTLTIPKFKLKNKVLLTGVLKELGLTNIFDLESDLQGITPEYKNLRVSNIIHESNVEIDEDGSTASAATAAILEVLSFPKSSDHLTFKADHPFLFFIIDRVNQIPLFAGKVADPS